MGGDYHHGHPGAERSEEPGIQKRHRLRKPRDRNCPYVMPHRFWIPDRLAALAFPDDGSTGLSNGVAA
jgi:hypothetical protein